MSKKIAIGGDHAGFDYKQQIRTWLENQAFSVADYGPYTNESCDYPEASHALASAVESGEYDLGILICGSGNGVCMTANKHQNIRAALVWNVELAALCRQHNNANVICIPARFIELDLALDCVKTFINTNFEGGRHATRVDKIAC